MGSVLRALEELRQISICVNDTFQQQYDLNATSYHPELKELIDLFLGHNADTSLGEFLSIAYTSHVLST